MKIQLLIKAGSHQLMENKPGDEAEGDVKATRKNSEKGCSIRVSSDG